MYIIEISRIKRNFMKLKIFFFLIIVVYSCQTSDKQDDERPFLKTPTLKRDFKKIQEQGVLKAITVYSGTSYFIYRGKPMGFEYELLRRLADSLHLNLEIVIVKNINELISMLNSGEGDIIAHGLTVTKTRKEYVNFTDYLYLSKQVLVQRKPDNWRQMKLHEIQKELVSDPIELIGDTVSVRRNSSYFYRLKNLSEELGGVIHIDTIPGNVSTDRIIEMVVNKEIKYTVADDNIASINSSYYPILDVNTPVSFSQRNAWAVRKNSPELLGNVNDWIDKIKDNVDYYVIYNNYFENTRSFKRRTGSEFYSLNEGRISPYDEIVKEYDSIINWDWRFICSIIYQESQFNPLARSWADAGGLMQLMETTAKEVGVVDITDPAQNIRGGIQYLEKLSSRFSQIPDSVQRVKFTLASYNCGYNHVRDAMKLAEEDNKNHERWDDHVEEYILKLSYPEYYNSELVDYGYVKGIEPYNYVRKIFQRYQHYKELIPSDSM